MFLINLTENLRNYNYNLKVNNLKWKIKPVFYKMKCRINNKFPIIKKKYSFKNYKYYRGVESCDNTFLEDFLSGYVSDISFDRSFKKGGIFDYYNVIFEFTENSKNPITKQSIIHHNDCYRGFLFKENLNVLRIFFTLENEKNISKFIANLSSENKEFLKKGRTIFTGILYDIDNINLCYICYEFVLT